ncbi:MAG: CHAP domain-containing protein [Streptosporangiales bacterium]|nr:CHAP domain-containing protein [Streptosporangiales bacterium]
MNYHYLGAAGVFVAGFLVHLLWAEQSGAPAPVAASTVSAAATASAAYPYAKAVCEFGRRGGSECVNPRNSGDAYDWGYWKGRRFQAGDPWGYEYRNCTSYVAWRLARAGVPASLFGGLGNASDWIGEVKGDQGVSVSRTPSPGAVAVWDVAGVGHVAWVVAVRGSRVTVEDYNYAGTGVYDRHVIGLRPSGYIRFPRR